MSVRQAQYEIDSREFAEWSAFMAVEPMGEERADAQVALLALIQASVYAGKGHRPKFADFLPQYWKEQEPQSADELKRVMMEWAKSVEAKHGERRSSECGLGRADGAV